MTDQPDGPNSDAPERPTEETARMVYEQVCASHDGITDFRAKLLALLPVATGAGALFLLDPGQTGRNVDRSVLGPVGLFAFAVVVGLFLYELRGVQKCKVLRDCAAELERAQRVPVELGQYRARPEAHLHGLVGAEFAGWIVYVTVMAAWIHVAGVGYAWWQNVSGAWLALGYVLVLTSKAVQLVRRSVRRSRSSQV